MPALAPTPVAKLALTRHATLRAKQRGVPHHLLDALLVYGDLDAPVGDGCSVVRLSRERLRDRDLRGRLGAAMDRLKSLAVIVADETGEIVTVMHDHGRTDGRRYRPRH
jgi:hypothetical protein